MPFPTRRNNYSRATTLFLLTSPLIAFALPNPSAWVKSRRYVSERGETSSETYGDKPTAVNECGDGSGRKFLLRRGGLLDCSLVSGPTPTLPIAPEATTSEATIVVIPPPNQHHELDKHQPQGGPQKEEDSELSEEEEKQGKEEETESESCSEESSSSSESEEEDSEEPKPKVSKRWSIDSSLVPRWRGGGGRGREFSGFSDEQPQTDADKPTTGGQDSSTEAAKKPTETAGKSSHGLLSPVLDLVKDLVYDGDAEEKKKTGKLLRRRRDRKSLKLSKEQAF